MSIFEGYGAFNQCLPGISLPRLMKSSVAMVMNNEEFLTNMAGPVITSHLKRSETLKLVNSLCIYENS